jgi:hypothetical protein
MKAETDEGGTVNGPDPRTLEQPKPAERGERDTPPPVQSTRPAAGADEPDLAGGIVRLGPR